VSRATTDVYYKHNRQKRVVKTYWLQLSILKKVGSLSFFFFLCLHLPFYYYTDAHRIGVAGSGVVGPTEAISAAGLKGGLHWGKLGLGGWKVKEKVVVVPATVTV
jgi:hypothetical protein